MISYKIPFLILDSKLHSSPDPSAHLHLGDHAGPDSLHFDHDSVSVALAALLLCTDGAAPALARLAQAHSRDLNKT